MVERSLVAARLVVDVVEVFTGFAGVREEASATPAGRCPVNTLKALAELIACVLAHTAGEVRPVRRPSPSPCSIDCRSGESWNRAFRARHSLHEAEKASSLVLSGHVSNIVARLAEIESIGTCSQKIDPNIV